MDRRSFVTFLRSLPDVQAGAPVLRLFDHKEAFAAYGDFARQAAASLKLTLSSLGSGADAVPCLTLKRQAYCTLLRRVLLEESNTSRVELWHEASRGRWLCAKSASPGLVTAFEPELYGGAGGAESDAPLLAAVRVVSPDRTVGLAYLNSTTRELGCTSFTDDESFSGLEAALAQLGVRECVVPHADLVSSGGAAVEARRLREALLRAGCLASELKSADFSAAEAERALAQLLHASEPVEMHRALLERPGCAAALGGLIRFSELCAAASSGGAYKLCHLDTGRYMRLDAAALRALHVLKERPGGGADSGFSLLALLNRCKTAQGKRLLARWLKQPLVHVPDIEGRLDVVEALSCDAALRDALRGSHLRPLPDVERLVGKLERRGATLQDLCRLYQASQVLELVASALDEHEGPHAGALRSRYAGPLRELHAADGLQKFEGLLETAVDLSRVPDEYLIHPHYDEALAELAETRESCDADIQRCFADAARELGVERDKTLKLDHSPQLGWFFRLSQKEEAAARAKIAERFQQLEARKDGVKFTCTALRRASDARVSAERDYAAAQRTLVERVVDVAASFAPLLHKAGALLSELDVLASFADVAATAPSPYTRPVLHAKDSGRDVLRLVGCRHPCVEALGSGEFVPNDCLMAKGDSWFQIITGPNMGGKSTFIRQVGVCVLLAQVGCFVPAQEAELVVRDAIFCRVGAGDCQLRGISTFMAEMLETAAILRSATPSSLVIIDELGRGTSTYDGFGLAWAIAEHICNELQAPALFATHFHELTSLQGAGGVKNLHVAASMDPQGRKLTMLYALRGGACDQSFGIHCAEFARFPPEVLHAARLKAAELEQHGGTGGADESLRRGAQAARAFLAEVAALPAEQQTPEALRAARARMLAAAQGSPYLDALIAAAQ